MRIEFTWRGLQIQANISEYDPGDWLNPPDGGMADTVEWEVDDLDDVLHHLEVDSDEVRDYYALHNRLPEDLVQIVEGWDLCAVAQERYWETRFES